MNILDELIGLVSAKFSIFKAVINMIKLETRLAGLSVFPLFVSLIVLLTLILTLWLTAMGLAVFTIMLWYPNIFIALSSVILLNFIVMGGVAKYMLNTLKNMSFANTRQFLAQSKEMSLYERQKADTAGNSGCEKDLADTANKS